MDLRTPLLVVVAGLLGCGGARHRKVAGPPPEYEPPEEHDGSLVAPVVPSVARVPSDGGTRGSPR